MMTELYLKSFSECGSISLDLSVCRAVVYLMFGLSQMEGDYVVVSEDGTYCIVAHAAD